MDVPLPLPTRLLGEDFGVLFRGAPGAEVHLSPGCTLALSGYPGDYWLNAVVVGERPDATTTVRTAVTTLRDRSLRGPLR